MIPSCAVKTLTISWAEALILFDLKIFITYARSEPLSVAVFTLERGPVWLGSEEKVTLASARRTTSQFSLSVAGSAVGPCSVF